MAVSNQTCLERNPCVAALRGVALGIREDDAVLKSIGGPAFLEEVDLNILRLGPLGLGDDVSEGCVFSLTFRPAEDSQLAACRDSARDGLVDVDDFNTLLVLVVIDRKSDGSDADGLSLDPADALHREDGVDPLVREAVVLERALAMLRKLQESRVRTMTYLPEMLRLLRVAGVAIVEEEKYGEINVNVGHLYLSLQRTLV